MHDDPTEVRDGATPVPRHRDLQTRFTPGVVVADRYRIVSLLGSGGMGEVYRADDLKLGQRVALKYVPENLAHNAMALESLYEEVRVGRQVSHPNVCRLYDIIEADGQHFIAMEFVDGEDLASLLRRIGRLPADKAVAVARDICAGLAAAHDVGFIHRDLKPANIMIDSRGTARITDFGLAAAAEEEIRDRAGTPAYMAPEQLRGDAPSKRSDIYALGVLLYEMFTGRRLFSGNTLDEIRNQHTISKTKPSSIVGEINPAVERVILRCLEEEPNLRPPTVAAVMQALPGGDPLQAAIAAGETPSPELVAAAGEIGDLPIGRAWSMFALVLVLCIAAITLGDRLTLPWFAAEVKSPEVLADRARVILRELGIVAPPVDSHGWYIKNADYVRKFAPIPRRSLSIDSFRDTPPSTTYFRYRHSPVPLAAWQAGGVITPTDPPENAEGMATVIVDAQGRLRFFRRIPGQHDTGVADPFDWSIAFREAGLDMSRFRAVAPEWLPSVGVDRRYAWVGAYTERPDLKIRVEASTAANRPAWFSVIEPWVQPARSAASQNEGGSALAILFLAGLTTSGILARRNWRRGRGDRKGALRIGIVIAVVSFAGDVLIAHHTPLIQAEWSMITRVAGMALFNAIAVWLFYLSVEPFVRLHSPHILVSWSRMLAGRVRDPLVGRDLLTGIAAGLIATIAVHFHSFVSFPIVFDPLGRQVYWSIMGTPAAILGGVRDAIVYGLGILIIFVFFRRLLHRDAVAFALTTAIVATVSLTPPLNAMDAYIDGLLVIGILVVVLWRCGILACAAALYAHNLSNLTAVNFDIRQWYAAPEIVAVLVILALAGFGFVTALAGKPLFGAALVEDEAPA